jgi:hypothetical protein
MSLRAAVIAVVSILLILLGTNSAVAKPPSQTLEIGTMPAMAGFPITLDGQTVATDDSGVARFKTTNVYTINRRVKLHERRMSYRGSEAKIVASRLCCIRSGEPKVLLDIYWPVRFSYLDVTGAPVDVNRIHALHLKSSTGELRRVGANEKTWLHGMRVVPLAGGMETKKVYWTVQSVEYAGTNVVNSSQQRFQPADVQSVQLKLLFYRTSVKVRDAFFGFGVGRSVLLTYPDQETVSYRLSERNEVELPSLPRGDFTLSVTGPGPKMTRPVAVSRDQTLDLKFYSWLDVGVALGFIGLFGFGTLWVGWRRRRAASKSRPVLVHSNPAADRHQSWSWGQGHEEEVESTLAAEILGKPVHREASR